MVDSDSQESPLQRAGGSGTAGSTPGDEPVPVAGAVFEDGPARDEGGSSSDHQEEEISIPTADGNNSSSEANPEDPMGIGRLRREDVSEKQMKSEYPKGDKRKLKEFYTRQNELIDQFLGADDEERNATKKDAHYRPRIKFAVRASFSVNFCLFVIQLFAAISTQSLSLFATAADAFMDLVSSTVMLVTSKLASRPNVYKYPVGRTRVETIGIILFCSLMTTVAIELLIESARTLGDGPKDSEPLKIVPLVCVGVAIFAKSCLMTYCFFYRRFPSVHVFFVDHRNDIVVNCFGLIMSIIGDRFVWYLDPLGAMLIALLILFSWVTNAFEQVFLLIGKTAPKEFISKLIYLSITHDSRIAKVDTCRAYHNGQKYYVEIDLVMDENLPLKVTHDVGQTLQRKIEGLEDVERAFVHMDYEHDHDVNEEHKPPYEKNKGKRSLKGRLFGLFKKQETNQDSGADE